MPQSETALPEQLAKTLPRYLAEVPLYQQWPAPRFATPASAQQDWQRLPLITKADIRRNFPANFLGPDTDLDWLIAEQVVEVEHTSGSSGEPTPLLLPYGWWATQELRALRLNSLVAGLLAAPRDPCGREHPSAPHAASAIQSRCAAPDPGPLKLPSQPRRITINSPACSSEVCYTGVPSPQERTVGSTLFLSLSRYPFLWTEADLARMAAEALQWQPLFLDLDPVYGVVFALYCERRALRLPSLKFILCSYEFLSVNHRRILQRAFGVPVFNLYGSTETGHLLMEDPLGQMRPSLQTAWLELFEPAADGIAELVVTTLTNQFMPLLRYRIGDLVARTPGPSGSRYVVHGRAADTLVSAQGRRVTTGQLDQCFADLPGIAHYQLVQRNRSEWRLRYVPDPGAPAATQESIRERLSGVLQTSAGLQIEPTDLLVPETSGKFRLTSYPNPQSPTSAPGRYPTAAPG